MAQRATPNPAIVREHLRRAAVWVRENAGSGRHQAGVPEEVRDDVAAAVRGSLALLAAELPGHAVEVRVPPFGAVQCVAGPRHTRGTPPNVVETDAATWLALVGDSAAWDVAVESGALQLSGVRAGEIRTALPVLRGGG